MAPNAGKLLDRVRQAIRMKHYSDTPGAFPACQGAGDQVGQAQGFGDVAVKGESFDGDTGFLDVQADHLDEDWADTRGWLQCIDQAPLARATRYSLQQGFADGCQIGSLADDDQHGQIQAVVQVADVDHVEAGQGESLEQDELHVCGEPGGGEKVGELPGGIGPVPADMSGKHAVQAHPGAHRADHGHISPVVGRKRSVVEADGVGEPTFHGACGIRSLRERNREWPLSPSGMNRSWSREKPREPSQRR